MDVVGEEEGGLVLDEGEVVLDEAHVVALPTAAEVSLAVDEVRNTADHQDGEGVPDVRDLDIDWVQSVSEDGGHGPGLVFPDLMP